MELTEAQRAALMLLNEDEYGISADDERADQFSDDNGGEPDTWNQLFNAGLAEQRGPGWSGDEFSLHITDVGRKALEEVAAKS